MTRIAAALLTAALTTLNACGSTLGDDDVCRRDVVESDISESAWRGPGLTEDGRIPPGSYVMSTTYLRLQDGWGTTFTFWRHIASIGVALQDQPGLVGWTTASSSLCNTQRTLAVWKDEKAMVDFVIGDAHTAAVEAIGDMSRGGSITQHWPGTEADAVWAKARQELGAINGPLY